MKVVRFYGSRDIRIEEEEKRELMEDEVRVKILWCGICDSDVLEFISGPTLYRKDKPIIPGHECGGVVIEKGEKIEKLEEGDKVYMSPLIYCGDCKNCSRGRENICYNGGYLGFTEDGGFREEIILKEKNLYRADPDVKPHILPFAQETAVSVHASLKGIGEKFLVVGNNSTSLILSQILKDMGGDVYISMLERGGREIIEKFGFKLFDDKNNDEKFDTVFDVVDSGPEISMEKDPLSFSLSHVDMGGKLVVVGIHTLPIKLNFLDILSRELDIDTSYEYTPLDFERAVGLIESEKIVLEPLITKKILLEDIEEEGFVELETNKKERVKILVTPFEEVLNES